MKILKAKLKTKLRISQSVFKALIPCIWAGLYGLTGAAAWAQVPISSLALWTPGLSTASLLWRPSLSGRGSVQMNWSYPVTESRPDGLRWYLRLFSGYGETMLDYNFRQTSMGLGLTIFKF